MILTRRTVLAGAAAIATVRMQAAPNQETHRFRAAEDLEIEMTIRFHNRYRSDGFWFRDQLSGRSFRLSAKGESGRGCMGVFHGSLAVAEYRVRRRAGRGAVSMLREYVRTIDHDPRVEDRPPVERTIKLERGVGSDLQAFGYEPSPGEEPLADEHGPWYLYRQDLFIEPLDRPFLAVFWKHALPEIRVLDIIPGDQTWLLNK